MSERQSFIAEARRAQLIRAVTAVLNEYGYVNSSLAVIARQAGISTALISYHFADKSDLMNHVLISIVADVSAHVLKSMHAVTTPWERVRAFIESSVGYQASHPDSYGALLEIIFGARTPDGTPYYRLQDDEPEPEVVELRNALADGQSSGEFRSFDISFMTMAIRGAVFESVAPGMAVSVDTPAYARALSELFERAIVAATPPT